MERQIMMIVVLLYITATLLFSGDPLLNPPPQTASKSHVEPFAGLLSSSLRERP